MGRNRKFRDSLRRRSCCLAFALILLLSPGLAWTQEEAGSTETGDSGGESGSPESTDETGDKEKKEEKSEEEADEEEEIAEDAAKEKEEKPPRVFPDMNSKEKTVSIDFTNTDINQIIKIMSEMSGENFLVDKSVSGTVTIISPTKVTPREAYDIFMSVLAVNGFTVVKVGKITKIIPIKDAATSPIPTRVSGLPRGTDAYITQLVPLSHIDANDVVTAFRGLVSSEGNLFAYGPSNMVIILDTASNIQRLMKILMRLDVAGGDQGVTVIPLEYAAADELAEVILELFQEMATTPTRRGSIRSRLNRRNTRRGRTTTRGGGASSIPSRSETKVLADLRTNSLIIRAGKVGIRQIRALVAQLDTPLPGGEGKIHVVYLENADADELAQTLAELAGTAGGTGRTGRNTRTQRRNPRNTRNMARGLTGALGGRGAGSQRIGQTSGRFLADFGGAVRITSEPATNSLVIIASARDFKILKEVIDKLDIPRRQVFVEALIMEISMDRGLDVGFEFRSTNDMTEDGVQVIGGTNYGGIQQAAANPLGISGFAIGAADGTITFAGETFPNIGALFRAMATDQDVNVLSTPYILTLDNEEAEVVVADNVPFVTGQIFSTSNNNPTTTIERKDVGITLRLTPQINESDMVKLTIFQEVSQVTDSPEGLSAAAVGVTTAKRTATTVVTVKDRQTVIIGGLLKDSVTVVESKVPILGDIPLLGYLFKSSKKKVSKTNLLIFLTPYIIKDPSDLEEVTRLSHRRMETFREENQIPQRGGAMGMLDPDKMTPRQSVFQAPMGESIETDPRLRRQMEESKENPRDSEKEEVEEFPDADTEDRDASDEFEIVE